MTTTAVRASEQADGQFQTPASEQAAEGVRVASPLEHRLVIDRTEQPDLTVNTAIAPNVPNAPNALDAPDAPDAPDASNLKLKPISNSEQLVSEEADLTDVWADASTINGPTELSASVTTDWPNEATESIELPNGIAEFTIETTDSLTGFPELISDEMDSESAETASSPRWRFTFEPYVYIPLNVEGEIGINNYEPRFGEDINLIDINRVLEININTNISNVIDVLRDRSFFGFMGRTEAWRNRFGIIFDASYISLSQNNTTSLNVPDRLINIIPSEIEVDTHFSYGQFDLGVGYRFADGNFTEAATDFDLGPVVFDVMGGMRLYTISSGIDISTNLGRSREFDRDTTFLAPLLSSRLRWNMSRDLALNVRGDIAGFGVSGLDLAWSATTSLDWMFSGNTSFVAGYRFSSIDYSRDFRNRSLNIDLLFHGPYFGMVFRF